MRADELLKSVLSASKDLKIKKNKLICKIKPEAKSLMDKEVERRLKNFANASNLNYEIV